MKKVVFLFVSLSIIFLSSVFAQGNENIVISPHSIVINPYATSAYNVEVFVDRDQSGMSIPTYNLGDPITINVHVNQGSYVYLFNVRSNGSISQLIPNRFGGGTDNYVNANLIRTFPAQNSGFRFVVDAPLGLDKVIAVASKQPLNVTKLASFNSDPNFASSNIGEQGFARTLSIILDPLPQNDWVTDTVLFNVLDNTPPPPPIYGTINIQCNISNAAIYVDGLFRGFSRAGEVMSIADTAGSHTIRISVSGYNVFEQTVNVVGGQSTSVIATLNPPVRRGTVSFDSTPRGATVYLNGTNIGVTPIMAKEYNSGNYSVLFRKAGYADSNQQFSVAANQNFSVNASLAHTSATLIIHQAVVNSRLFIDGRDYGTISAGEIKYIDGLREKYYEVIVVADGYSAYFKELYLSGRQDTEIWLNQTRR